MRVLDDDEVLYVGKADSMLGTRLKAHTRGVFDKEPAQQMASDYKDYIRGHTVTIWAHAPKRVKICGMDVYPHAGLESAMIERYKPRFVLRR